MANTKRNGGFGMQAQIHESACAPLNNVNETLLEARARSLGLEPVRAFVLPSGPISIDLAQSIAEQPKIKKQDAAKTARSRAGWRERGFKQLVLTVPDTEEIRSAFRTIEAGLKSGESWSEALCRDPAIARLVSSNEEFARELSMTRNLLEKCQRDLNEARSPAKPRSLLEISRGGFRAVKAIVDSLFIRRRFETK